MPASEPLERRQPPEPPGLHPATATPLVIIGGYLGAGKTTLVNHLLRHAGGRRIAVLVNDFGSVSIDASLIVGAADGVLALAGGCVCCAYGADLVSTLNTAVQRQPAPDLVLVECSGVGLPAAVARTAGLARGVKLDGIVLVLDALDWPQQLRDPFVGDTVREQARQADLVVVNQTDRLEHRDPGAAAASASALEAALAEWAPQVPRIYGSRAQVAAEAVLGLRPVLAPSAAHAPRASTSSGLPPGDSARPLGPGPVWAAAQRFRFDDREVLAPVDALALAASLAAPGSSLLRAKGVVCGLDGRPWRIQVMGRRWEAVPLSDVDAAALPAGLVGRLACIGPA